MTDKEKAKQLERLRNNADSICRGARYEAADAYIEAMTSLPADIKRVERSPLDEARNNYLSGWDDAMELNHEELFEENNYLHGVLIDLCTRMLIKRCLLCKGHGMNPYTGDDCPDCENGWLPVTSTEPEEIIAEIKRNHGP